MKQPFARCGKAGFTLVELLVVVAIIGILISMITPAVGNAMARARTLKCSLQLRELARACIGHAGENDGALPTARRGSSVVWPYDLSPYTAGAEWSSLYEGVDSPDSLFYCPEANPSVHFSKHYASLGLEKAFWSYGINQLLVQDAGHPDWQVYMDIASVNRPTDCALLQDLHGGSQRWCLFREWDWDPTRYGYPHGDMQRNVAFLDGHVEAVDFPLPADPPVAHSPLRIRENADPASLRFYLGL
jgi:prepilin-type N-terminal cleavage/methylation domain-containing protein/prepilin-type processing-associated H-X9-DG protein